MMAKDPEERLPQQMIPQLSYTINVPCIRKATKITLSNNLKILNIQETLEDINFISTWKNI